MNWKQKIILTSITILGVSLSSSTVWAGYPALPELLANILLKQPEQKLLQGFKDIQNAQYSLSQNWLGGDVDVIVNHENDALTDNEKVKNWQLGVEFPIALSRQRQAEQLVGTAYNQYISSQQNYLKWLASAKLRDLLWQYKISQIQTSAAQNALLKSRALHLKVSKKVKAGESPEIDLLLANKEIFKHQKEFVDQQTLLEIAKNNFQVWTQTNQLPENIIESTIENSHLDQHPEILKLRSQLEINQSELIKVKSYSKESPRIFLGAKNDHDSNTNNTALVFQLSVPLGINPSNDVHIAKQNQSIYEQQAKIERAKIELQQTIYQAKQELSSAYFAIRFSEKQFRIAQKALNMSETAYQLGESNIQNLLLVQQQTLNAKLEFELAKARQGHAIAIFNQVSGNILGAQ